MKFSLRLSAVAALASSAEASNPLSKALELMDSLTQKINQDAAAEAKAYGEFVDWCKEFSRNKGFEIKTASSQKEKLEAEIAKQTGNSEASAGRIDDLAASIAKDDKELKDATTIRTKEKATFTANEAELADVTDTLSRASAILQREMQKNPTSFAQIDTSNMKKMLTSISSVMDAAAFASNDKQKLLALVQSQQESADEDESLGAPAAAVYNSHSNNILDVLEDMKEKAEEQLGDLRKAEVNNNHNFAMLKQSLEDSMKADNKDLEEEKAAKSAADEARATATADLDATEKDLADSKSALANSQRDCDQTTADHEATVAARAEELKTIADAKSVLSGATGGAESQTYSLLQLNHAKPEVAAMVKRLAKVHRSSALAQLASRIDAVMRLGSGGRDDVFGKVKTLISSMIEKLEGEMDAEASEKAYCDEQIAKTSEKKADLESDISRLTSKIDSAAAKSAGLKAEVRELQAELASLAKLQAELDQTRQDEHAAFLEAKSDLEQGLEGVRQALSVLREYYGGSSAFLQSHADSEQPQPARPELYTKSSGAGSSIVGILEVVESDFAKNLAKETTEEDDSESEYQKAIQENKVTKALKDKDVEYKSKEAVGLDKRIADMSGDRDTANSELSAVNSYFSKIQERCIAKPETYEERKRRREEEINGLKEALSVLEDETAFVQKRRKGAKTNGFLGVE